MKKFYLILATGFGFGYAPVASGIFGTLVGIPIVWALAGVPGWLYAVLTLLLLLVGIKAADFAEEYFNKEDAGQIVIDEVVGYMVTMYLVPVSLGSLVAGFFVFRFFDIFKPWPARGIDKEMPGGAGVMLDDVSSGVYSCIVMHLLYHPMSQGLFSLLNN